MGCAAFKYCSKKLEKYLIPERRRFISAFISRLSLFIWCVWGVFACGWGCGVLGMVCALRWCLGGFLFFFLGGVWVGFVYGAMGLLFGGGGCYMSRMKCGEF